MSNRRLLLKGAGPSFQVLSSKDAEQAMERPSAIIMAVGVVSSFGFGGLFEKPQKALASIVSIRYA